MKKLPIIFIPFLVFTNMIQAQTSPWHLYLSNNEIYCIAVESYYVWTATNNGLAEINVKTGESSYYTFSNSDIPTYSISQIAIDSQGTKWMVSDKGLIKFNGLNWDVYQTSDFRLNDGNFGPLALDGEDNKWFSTGAFNLNAGNLIQFNDTSSTVYNPSNSDLPACFIVSVAIDQNDDKWLGTSQGFSNNSYNLIKFDGKDWTIFDSSATGLATSFFGNICFDKNGDVWMSAFLGLDWPSSDLIKFDGKTWTVYNNTNSGLPACYISGLAIDNNDTKWIASTNGLIKFDGTNWENYNTSNSAIPSDQLRSIVIDGDGTKWLGTDMGLVSFIENIETSSLEGKTQLSDIMIFPNPFKYSISVENHSAIKISSLELYNMAGSLMKDQIVQEKNMTLHLADVPDGVYLLKLHTREGILVMKLIKQF